MLERLKNSGGLDTDLTMQRNNNSTMRTVFLVCLFVTVLLAFLYIMKRIEVNKIYRDVEIMKVERRELEEDLNSKLSDHLEKIESLSQEVGQLQSRLTRCEDEKAAAIVDSDKIKKEKEECMIGRQDLHIKQDDLEVGFNQLKGDHEVVSSQLSKVNQEMASLRASLASSHDDAQSAKAATEKCEEELGQCEVHADGLEQKLIDCKNSCPQQQEHEVDDQQEIDEEAESDQQAQEAAFDDAYQEEGSKPAEPLYRGVRLTETDEQAQGQTYDDEATYPDEQAQDQTYDNELGEALEADNDNFNLEAAINDYWEINNEQQQL